MSLGITERRVEEVVVLELTGRLTLGPGCDALNQRLHDVVNAGSRAILLHCGGLSGIDSQGLRALVRAVTQLQEQGGALKLCALPARVQEVLRVTRLLGVLETFPGEAEALASFKPAPGTA